MKYLPGRLSESCLMRSSAVFKSTVASNHTGPAPLPSGEPEKNVVLTELTHGTSPSMAGLTVPKVAPKPVRCNLQYQVL